MSTSTESPITAVRRACGPAGKGHHPRRVFDIRSAKLPSRMALKKLHEVGLIKFLVSTNLDGLHFKSGMTPLVNMAEMHGSMWYERCVRCHKDPPTRPFPVRRGGDQPSHTRGRQGAGAAAVACTWTAASISVRHCRIFTGLQQKLRRKSLTVACRRDQHACCASLDAPRARGRNQDAQWRRRRGTETGKCHHSQYDGHTL